VAALVKGYGGHSAHDRGAESSLAMPNMPIDWASVNWLYLVLLLLLVFFCALIGNVIAFKRVLLGAVLATLLFAAGFFFWTYYPHNLPLPTSPVGQKAAAPVQATPTPTLISPSPPAKPNNPVRDVTSPSTGVH
jgi:hypothetical protein